MLFITNLISIIISYKSCSRGTAEKRHEILFDSRDITDMSFETGKQIDTINPISFTDVLDID